MGLFNRVSDIVSANIHEMIERFEDPEKMLKQAIREMEVSIAETTTDATKSIGSEKRLAKELAHNQSEAKVWQTRAEQAVEAEDDELARRALARKQEHTKLVAALQDQFDTTKEAADVLRRQLDAMKVKLEEAQRSLGTLSARKKAADARKKVYSQLGESVKLAADDSAFRNFERMRERVEQAESEADALAELQGMTGSKVEFNSVAEIDSELAQLKQRKLSR